MNKWAKLSLGVGAAALLSLAPVSAEATLTLQPGLVGGSGDVSNVVFNPCGLGPGIGMTVLGCLNDSNATLVSFTGNENLQIQGGGQARVGAVDGAYSSVQIKLAAEAQGFTKLQFNIDSILDGTATFVGVDQFGTSFNFGGAFAISGNGQNFFTMLAEDDQVATSFTITSSVPMQNIGELQQVRIVTTALGVCPNGAPNFPICTPQVVETPEPMSMAMLGMGLLGLGMARIRRRSA